MKAIWNNSVIAESPQVIEFEGQYYFPLSVVDPSCLRLSGTTTVCLQRGRISHFTLKAGRRERLDAVLHFEDPPNSVRELANHVTFVTDVDIVR